ncbi:feruloyl esterase [Altererythrobacter atlanticus]|uniref:Tannase and feruloyl esterase n=1 Tax=Croceibacterium atlanticum TaxID=1267766 RepID=A0A0F7KQV9_9SPHN|nr:tannase/feruloyl esterase family alpha/beta hydrolase [Croceibacterium atlanticum]AKH41954.1 Tannase and feruloyl esterase [Croceibacterium atlanticum]MBB5733478.1 feruloyl esterase [Croceibacterium atlanticum]
MFLSLIALVMQLAGLPASAEEPAGFRCSDLAGRNGDVEIIRATNIAPGSAVKSEAGGYYSAQPVNVPFCRVEGLIEGDIGFELWLPESWNGRLLGAGVGGDAGVYNLADMSLRIGQGFATVTTDTGHKANEEHWMLDGRKRDNYEHRAVHLTAQAARKLAKEYYGRPVDHAYFTGCSGGGRQALKEMQLYPHDYDGVLAGAPAPYMPLQSVRMLWFSLEQQKYPDAALSDADWSLYERRVTRQCDADDNVTDGIIENPATCDFDLSQLACSADADGECIAAPQLAMLARIVSPMRDSSGGSHGPRPVSRRSHATGASISASAGNVGRWRAGRSRLGRNDVRQAPRSRPCQ